MCTGAEPAAASTLCATAAGASGLEAAAAGIPGVAGFGAGTGLGAYGGEALLGGLGALGEAGAAAGGLGAGFSAIEGLGTGLTGIASGLDGLASLGAYGGSLSGVGDLGTMAGFDAPASFTESVGNSFDGTSPGDAGLGAKDSQAFNASQPFGNRGLQGMYDAGSSFLKQPLFNGGPSTLTGMQAGSSLYDLYAKNQMAKAQKDRYTQITNQINGSYAPGSPEFEYMKNELARKDAAAGRNSQYGNRAVQLQANIAGIKNQALGNTLTGMNQLQTNYLGNQYGGLNSLFGYANKNDATQKVLGT